MASLTGQKIKDTYQSLLKTDDNGLITNAFKGVTDGSGSSSGLYLKNDGVQVNGTLVVSGSLIYSGSTINATVTSASYALTASYALNGGGGGSTDTGSLLVTASVSSNTITFTKGDATTFDITVDTGSATPIDVSSFATTGSNTFVGNQTISGSIIFEDGSTIENSWAYDTNTSGSIAWSNRQLYDTSENTSVNWETRQLLDDAGNSSVLTWGGGSPEFFGTSSYALTASYLEGGVGSIHTGSFATTGSNTFIGEQTISGSIQISGSIIPATDGISTTSSFDLGSATNAWKDIWVSNGTINFLDGAGNVQATLSSTEQGLTLPQSLALSASSIQSVSASSGDGLGASTLELKPDTTLGTDQYIVLDPTAPGHIHIRAGGPIDNSGAYLYLGGENNNVLIDDGGQRVQIASVNAVSIIGALEQGNNVLATGSYSHAQGNQTIASGSYSHAEGTVTQAIGDYSHAEGNQTKTGTQNAYYAQSVVNGVVTLSGSYGDVTSQFGANNRLYLYDAPFDANYNRQIYIISQSYFDSTNTIVELYDTGINTTTAYVGDLDQEIITWVGDQTIPGDYAHTEGWETQAIGLYSHAEGYQTNASGWYSHAEGQHTLAMGLRSHAEGDVTKAVGDSSHAEGENTQAIGLASHAEGSATQAIGDYSHAEGNYTIASGSYQHVSGQYNQHNNDTSYFVVGIGLSEETRKDGFTVDVDANGSGSVMIPHNLDAPSVAKTGSMYVDPTNNKLWIYTGNGGIGGWVTASLG